MGPASRLRRLRGLFGAAALFVLGCTRGAVADDVGTGTGSASADEGSGPSSSAADSSGTEDGLDTGNTGGDSGTGGTSDTGATTTDTPTTTTSDGCNYDPTCGTVPAGMVCVPAGVFERGSEAGFDDEKPVREVCMPTYHIDETEVTVSQYEDCVASGECTTPNTDEHCNWQVSGREDHPINCVDWDQAAAYCAWADKRLPTEAEWEKAARGTDARTYPWGEDLPTCEFAVMDEGGWGCGTDASMPVGSKSPAGDSPFGAKDMAGNVWEWCTDWWSDGYDAEDMDDPQGPAAGTWRVLRGGSWGIANAAWLRASVRFSRPPSGRNSFDGFRCARSADP